MSHGAQLWPLAVVGAALTLTNYVLLAKAYEHADLSFVYPISRGGVLIFVPILGFFVFGERLNARGYIAVGLILLGHRRHAVASTEPARARASARTP